MNNKLPECHLNNRPGFFGKYLQSKHNRVAVKGKRNKGMKNAGHGLNPGRRYWCHASDSLTEPSGPAASQRPHIPISLRYEPKFHRTATKLYLPTLTSLISTLTGRGISRLGIWQLYSCLWSYFAVGTVLTNLNEKLFFIPLFLFAFRTVWRNLLMTLQSSYIAMATS